MRLIICVVFVTGSVGLEVDTNSKLVRRKQEVEHNHAVTGLQWCSTA